MLALAVSADGHRLASIGRDRPIRLWEVGTWREALTVPIKDGLRPSLAFMPGEGHELIVATVDGVRVLDASRPR